VRVPFLRPLAAGMIAAALIAPGAMAATKVEITLNVDTFGGTELFTATGGFCGAGSATSSNFRFAGGGRAGTFHLDKTFTCDDGSGSLTIHLNAATDAEHACQQHRANGTQETGVHERSLREGR
jgi:hypothetical protein